jgi:hypothetical protein
MQGTHRSRGGIGAIQASASWSARGLRVWMALRRGPLLSYASMRLRYRLTNWRQVMRLDWKAARISSIVASIRRKPSRLAHAGGA